MFEISRAVFESGEQDSAGDGAAGAVGTAHAETESLTGFKHGLFIHAD